jgi:hypothetical protein
MPKRSERPPFIRLRLCGWWTCSLTVCIGGHGLDLIVLKRRAWTKWHARYGRWSVRRRAKSLLIGPVQVKAF